MRTKKRDKVERVFHQGYKAGMRGHSSDFCPHTGNMEARGAWFSGWREGRSQFLSGYITESPTQLKYKVNILPAAF